MKQPDRRLLTFGFAPMPWYLFWGTIAALLVPTYSMISEQGSELTLHGGAPALLTNIASVGTGIAFILFSLGLWIESGKKFAVGATAWLLFGFSMVSNGIWPMGSPMHGAYAVGVFNIIAPAISQIESQKYSANKRITSATIFVSVSAIVYLWLNLTGNDPEGFRGLTQRIFSSINSFWPACVAYVAYSEHRKS